MSFDLAIKVENLSKCYQIYDQPGDRLKQFVVPRLRRLAGMPDKQYYNDFWALKDVSFEVKKGETLGIIGRNGSGKSTLLQMICGTLNPTRGRIQTFGRTAALLELGSGFNPEFTGRENVYLNASVLGLTQAEIDARCEDIVAFADIGAFINQPVKTYSSGMMVRLAFAVVAHVDADILVIDEALAVGDAVFTQKCMRFLRRFMRNGTVLFVSHDTSAVTSFCNNAILLGSGEVVATGSAKSVIERYAELNYQETQDIELSASKAVDDVQPTLIPQSLAGMPYRDMRAEFINASSLRNDIKVFAFNENAPAFGTGGASLVYLYLLDTAKCPLSYVVGGEDVMLEIAFKTRQKINNPIIGFTFKDRLGQTLFADNTYIAMLGEKIPSEEGETLIARFKFQMPVLPSGEYSISPAIADGSQDDHEQQCWVHDALILNVQASATCFGLIAWPMENVTLHKITEKNKMDTIS